MVSNRFFPCADYFAERRFAAGFVLLLMQISLVLWPWAVRIARQDKERSSVDRILSELSETHRVKPDPYAPPLKRFRQLA